MINFPNLPPVRPSEINRTKRTSSAAKTTVIQETVKAEAPVVIDTDLDRRQKRDRRQQSKKVPFDRRVSADRRKPNIDIEA